MHVFVDESRRREYIVCAVKVSLRTVNQARRTMADFRMPGQRRIHFVKERRARRCQILDALDELGVRANLYVSSGPDRRARAGCLYAMVTDLAPRGMNRLVLETIDDEVEYDRRIIYQAVHKVDMTGLSYEHMRAHEELLLCAADAVAWAYGSNSEWRRHSSRLIDGVRRVDPR